MNDLRGWVKRLEKGAGKYEHALTMPDGEQVKFTGEEMVDALIASIEEEEHRLLPYIRRMDTSEPIANLINSLEGNAGDGEGRDTERTR